MWNFIKTGTPSKVFSFKILEKYLKKILVEYTWNFGAWSNLKTYLEHIAWKICFPKIIFLYRWIEFSKLVYWVRNNSGVSLHLLLFSSSLRIMVWRKQKKCSIKTLNSRHCIQPKQHIVGCSGSEIVAKEIFNLDHRFYTLQKYLILQIADFTYFF